MDCCDLGNEESTYIWGVVNQRCCRNQLVRSRTHIGNIELKIGSDDNDGQGRERECPIRVTRALDSNEEEGNGVSSSSYAHQ